MYMRILKTILRFFQGVVWVWLFVGVVLMSVLSCDPEERVEK